MCTNHASVVLFVGVRLGLRFIDLDPYLGAFMRLRVKGHCRNTGRHLSMSLLFAS